jgi:hypothetical protein
MDERADGICLQGYRAGDWEIFILKSDIQNKNDLKLLTGTLFEDLM